jgi:hypothetical protein
VRFFSQTAARIKTTIRIIAVISPKPILGIPRLLEPFVPEQA